MRQDVPPQNSIPLVKPEPWLSIIGLGEDGLEGLSGPACAALDAADIVFGGERHLKLVNVGSRGRAWPVPFDLSELLAHREQGQPIAVLASGDPFWHGVGGSIARKLPQNEWQVYPQASCLSLAASRMGWSLEQVTSLGLHAAPFERMLPGLSRGCRILCTLRDGTAPRELANWLSEHDMGKARLTVLEALGGEHERIRESTAADFVPDDVRAPVVVAVDGSSLPRGSGLPRGFGIPDDAFVHDGQITKRPVRALTLSALAPRAGEHLWDLGAGSASIAVEWCLNGGSASAVERQDARLANIDANVAAFGLQGRLVRHAGSHLDCLDELPTPDAVFIGGGASAELLEALWERMPQRCRLVVNTVTLETETLVIQQHARLGGSLLRIDLAAADTLGKLRGWKAARPIVQWSVVR